MSGFQRRRQVIIMQTICYGRNSCCNCVSQGYLDESKRHQYYSQPIFFTEDLGFYDELNNLYIVGRKGLSIKVNGFRVNLKEIEFGVVKYGGIDDCIAFKNKESGTISIVIESNNEETIVIGKLRKFLRELLPTYMLPKEVHQLRSIPKNINGKIDRKYIVEKFSST